MGPVVVLRDDNTDYRTGGEAEGGQTDDVEIFINGGEEGRGVKCVQQRESRR